MSKIPYFIAGLAFESSVDAEKDDPCWELEDFARPNVAAFGSYRDEVLAAAKRAAVKELAEMLGDENAEAITWTATKDGAVGDCFETGVYEPVDRVQIVIVEVAN